MAPFSRRAVSAAGAALVAATISAACADGDDANASWPIGAAPATSNDPWLEITSGAGAAAGALGPVAVVTGVSVVALPCEGGAELPCPAGAESGGPADPEFPGDAAGVDAGLCVAEG